MQAWLGDGERGPCCARGRPDAPRSLEPWHHPRWRALDVLANSASCALGRVVPHSPSAATSATVVYVSYLVERERLGLRAAGPRAERLDRPAGWRSSPSSATATAGWARACSARSGPPAFAIQSNLASVRAPSRSGREGIYFVTNAISPRHTRSRPAAGEGMPMHVPHHAEIERGRDGILLTIEPGRG
jgi:hypothetical protein